MAKAANLGEYRAIFWRWIDSLLMAITALTVCVAFDHIVLGQLERLCAMQESRPLIVFILVSFVGGTFFWVALLKLGGISPTKLFSKDTLRNPPVVLVGLVGFVLYVGYLWWPGNYAWICDGRITALGTGFVLALFGIGGVTATGIHKMWRADETEGLEATIANESSLAEITGDPLKLIKWIERETPIGSPEEDVLGATTFAKRILRLLRRQPVQTIGVVGPYGCGKSSILNLLAHYITCAPGELVDDDTSDGENLWPIDEMVVCWVKSWGQTEGNAAQHILRAAVRELSQHTDCIGLEDMPRRYRDAMAQPTGVIGRVINQFVGFDVEPDSILRRLDTVLKRAGKRLIIIIEDVDRNPGGEGFVNEIGSLLDNLKGLHNLSFVLAIGREFGREELIVRLTEQVETIPYMSREHTFPILRMFRKYCLELHPKDIDCLAPEKREKRAGFDRSETLDGFAVIDDSFKHTIDYAERLQLTPRVLKTALRRTWHAWSTLHGEIDFDDLLFCSILRIGAPEAFMFVNENSRRLQSLYPQPSGETGKERDEKSRAILEELFKDRVSKATWDITAARKLVEFLFPGWKKTDFFARTIDAPQGVTTYQPTDYWGRLNREELRPSEIRDQEVLHAISDWKTSYDRQGDWKYVLDRLSTESDLGNAMLDRKGFPEKVEQFGALLDGKDVRYLASEVFGRILQSGKSIGKGEDQGGFIELWRLSLEKQVNWHEEWVAGEIEKALHKSLRFANDIYYFWRLQDKGARHTWSSLALRKSVVALAQKIYGEKEDTLAAVLDTNYPYSIYHLVVLFGQEDQGGPGFDNEDWSWLSPVLLKGCRKHPAVLVPPVAVLAGETKHPFRKEEWDVELQPDRISKIFGAETHSLMKLLTVETDLSHLEQQAKLTVEAIRAKAAEWISRNQGREGAEQG